MKRIEPKTAIAAGMTVASIAIIAVFGSQLGIPPDVTQGALAFLGAIGTLALGAMRSIMRDAMEPDE